MKRYGFAVVLVLAAAASLLAQSPAGWKMRVDRSMNASDPDPAGSIKFVTMGSGFHATNPQAAVYWNPANTASGNYSLKGTFNLVNAGPHEEYYGLVFGGSGLEGAAQAYIYFMVEHGGSWLIKSRNGSSTAGIASSGGPSDVVKKAEEGGKSSNALEVHVLGDKIEFLVNGKVVNTTPKTAQTPKTDGVYGIRVNHMLEVQIDDFKMTKM
jgi:hypothetical protein